MTELKLSKGPYLFDDPRVYSSRRSVIRAMDLLTDVYDFLDKYFKGSFTSKIRVESRRFISFTESAFAAFVKLIFKTVYGKEPISVSAEAQENALILSFGFDLAKLESEAISMLTELSEKSGFTLKLSGGGVLAIFHYCRSNAAMLSSMAPRLVYRALIEAFRS